MKLQEKPFRISTFFVARSAIGAIHRKPSLTNSPSQSRGAQRADRLEGGD